MAFLTFAEAKVAAPPLDNLMGWQILKEHKMVCILHQLRFMVYNDYREVLNYVLKPRTPRT